MYCHGGWPLGLGWEVLGWEGQGQGRAVLGRAVSKPCEPNLSAGASKWILISAVSYISLQKSCVEEALAPAARRLTWGMLDTAARERSAQNSIHRFWMPESDCDIIEQ